MKHEGWPSGLSEHAAPLLDRYLALLLRYALPRGMISTADAAQVRERHLADSLRALPALTPSERAVDMGSGAGLPGVPLAIAVPDLHVVLAESRRTRIAFLELVIDELGLQNASVHAGRVEDLPRAFDVALARGFGDAGDSWRAAREVLTRAGRLFYWAGASFDAARVAPENAQVEVLEQPGLESQGPLVIMTRQ